MTVEVDTHFKSSLPPRKRAKTDEEKEQRRVERILRNRRAAHASREKKRKHVEYLEAYVLALEKNMLVLKANVDSLAAVAPKDFSLSSLPQPDDLSALQARIHSNLGPGLSDSSAPASFSADHSSSVSSCGDDPADEISDSRSPTIPAVKVKVEEVDGMSLPSASHSTNGYYNYLSPVSINSPINSPIDLKLKSDPRLSVLTAWGASPDLSFLHSDSFALAPTLGPDLLAQNSAAILSLGEQHR